jgi:hypothetical protein
MLAPVSSLVCNIGCKLIIKGKQGIINSLYRKPGVMSKNELESVLRVLNIVAGRKISTWSTI